VFASSAAVYGDKRGACGEEDSPEPRSPYAASKLAGEYYSRVYAKLYGIPTVILRYFNVYGPRQSQQYAGVITQFLKAVSRGRPPTIYGDGKQTRDFIFVQDVVRATLNSLHRSLPRGMIMNIGSGQAISVRELALRILRVAGRSDLRPAYAPAKPGDVKFSLANISRVRSRIGFTPRYDLDTGLKATFVSFQESGSRPRSTAAA
jgi:UDP-glucose 4-epimerase